MNLESKLYIEFWLLWSFREFLRDFGFLFGIIKSSRCLRMVNPLKIHIKHLGNLPLIYLDAGWVSNSPLHLTVNKRAVADTIDGCPSLGR